METGADAFGGTQRFEVLEQLGAGSMCVVYKVLDRRHGDVVALKTLRHLDSSSLYRLKQEFRALSAYDHPNLVSFYELVYADHAWFVTMELIGGVDFLTWVRGPEARKFQQGAVTNSVASDTSGRTDTSIWADLRFSHSAPAGAAADPEQSTTQFKEIPDGELPDFMKLRAGLRQLAEGIATLHEAGRLHRDLKPSNVLVTSAGRVVVLDFGLVAEVDQDYTEGTLHQNIAGSAAYMSPEQSVGKPLSAASDWYSVGVMLYESLTGVWPYSGHLYHILSSKQEIDPPAPNELLSGVPDDLNDLCMALLAREPQDRPDANQSLKALHSRRPVVGLNRTSARARFSFREPQMGKLTEAMQTTRYGRCGVALVRGPTGIGKTSLCREFIKKAKAEGVLTLKGRCYEWENLPYKALDGVMDNLTRALRRIDHREVLKHNSDELPYLAHVFPVLRRVDVLQLDEPVDIHQYTDVKLAELAFTGLLNLLVSLAQEQPLLIFIDDAHWGDLVSARILCAILPLLRESPILFVLAHQPTPRNAFIHELQDALRHVDVEVIDVDPFSMEQSALLAAMLLGTSRHDDQVVAIALESSGVPLHIREFVRQQTLRSESGEQEGVLDEVVVSEVRGLPEESALVLQLVALSDRPLSTATLLNAARMNAGDVVDALSTLSAHHLINTGSATVGDTMEIAGESIRDYVLSQIDDGISSELHLALAEAIEIDEHYDPEALVHHYVGAGQPERAGVTAWLAAQHALDAQNHRDAVWLLEQAIALGVWSHGELRQMQALLGRSYSKVGDGRRAAEAFTTAASDAPPEKQTQLRLMAMEQLLFAGFVGEANELLSPLLRDLELPRVPSSMAWWSTQWRRAGLWWRGTEFESRAEILIGTDALLKVDVTWLVAAGFGLLDPLIGAYFQTVHLAQALDLGEPIRIHRARALDLYYQARRTGSGWQELLLDTRFQSENQHCMFLTDCFAALSHFTCGAWASAIQVALEATEAAESAPRWQQLLLLQLRAQTHVVLGNLGIAAELFRPIRRQLTASQNPYFYTSFTCSVGIYLRMAEDDVERGLTEMGEVFERLPADTVIVPHVYASIARSLLDLYAGENQAAWDHLDAAWPKLSTLRGYLDPHLNAELLLSRARCALALRKQGVAPKTFGREASAMAEKLRRLPSHLHGHADLIDAILSIQDDSSAANRLLQQAAHALGESNFTLLSAAATRMLGILTDEDAGTNLRRDSETWLHAQGVRSAERFCAALAPGL